MTNKYLVKCANCGEVFNTDLARLPTGWTRNGGTVTNETTGESMEMTFVLCDNPDCQTPETFAVVAAREVVRTVADIKNRYCIEPGKKDLT